MPRRREACGEFEEESTCRSKIKTGKGLSRRALLKGAAGLAGAAAGSGAITGFPAVWSQEEKVLRYLGTAVNQSDDITKKVKEETGITIQNIVATTDDVTKRVITQPNSFDILDTEYFSLKKLVPSGNILPMDAKKIKEFDNITPVFTKGQLPNGKVIGDQGTAPKKVMFVEGAAFDEILEDADGMGDADPDRLQRRHARHPPRSHQAPDQLLGRVAEPRVQGQGGDPQHPLDRHHGRRDGGRGDRQIQISRQGQHDEARDRHDDGRADRGQEGRPVPRLLEGLQRERQPDGVGRDGHPVDVVAGRDGGAHQGHPLRRSSR